MHNGKAVIEKVDGGVAILSINNEERRNAISVEVRDALIQALDSLARDQDVRAIVLTGKGDHFCGGGDVKGFSGMALLEGLQRMRMMQRVLKAFLNIEKPVIAMVKGFAVGAGMNLTLACDMVFAAEDARFAQSFARVGLTSDVGGMCLLPLTVGLYRAKELLFSAKMIDAKQAMELGLVNRVHPKDKLEQETLAFAREVAAGASVVFALAKRIMHATYLDKLDQVLEMEAQAQAILFQTEDHKEGRDAFANKRAPQFRGA